MGRCHEYWRVAKTISDICARNCVSHSVVAKIAPDEHFDTLKENYRFILNELDHHTLSCPICSEDA